MVHSFRLGPPSLVGHDERCGNGRFKADREFRQCSLCCTRSLALLNENKGEQLLLLPRCRIPQNVTKDSIPKLQRTQLGGDSVGSACASPNVPVHLGNTETAISYSQCRNSRNEGHLQPEVRHTLG